MPNQIICCVDGIRRLLSVYKYTYTPKKSYLTNKLRHGPGMKKCSVYPGDFLIRYWKIYIYINFQKKKKIDKLLL